MYIYICVNRYINRSIQTPNDIENVLKAQQ